MIWTLDPSSAHRNADSWTVIDSQSVAIGGVAFSWDMGLVGECVGKRERGTRERKRRRGPV